jgi:hypothetical protein
LNKLYRVAVTLARRFEVRRYNITADCGEAFGLEEAVEKITGITPEFENCFSLEGGKSSEQLGIG